MALADFTFQTTNSSAAAAISGTSPLNGIGSADITVNANDSGDWVLGYTAGLDKNCVDIKAIFQQRNTQASFYTMGLFLQLQGAINVASSAYTCCLVSVSGGPGGSGRVVLRKGALTTAATDPTGNANYVVTTPALNVTFALGLRCEYVASTGDVYVTISYDPGPITTPVADDYAFPGLVVVNNFLDTSSPYTTGTFGAFGNISTGAPTQQLFDVMKIDTD